MIMLLMVHLIKITTVSGKFWCLSIHTITHVYIVAVLDLVVRANALVWIVGVWYFIARTNYQRKSLLKMLHPKKCLVLFYNIL